MQLSIVRFGNKAFAREWSAQNCTIWSWIVETGYRIEGCIVRQVLTRSCSLIYTIVSALQRKTNLNNKELKKEILNLEKIFGLKRKNETYLYNYVYPFTM